LIKTGLRADKLAQALQYGVSLAANAGGQFRSFGDPPIHGRRELAATDKYLTHRVASLMSIKIGLTFSS
jgi:hypothetical protein